LLFDPQAIFKFGANDIIIPITVIEEMDRFKRDLSENGRNARQFSRFLDQLRKQGTLSQGVKLPNAGIVTVELSPGGPLPPELSSDRPDNKILATAMSVRKANPKWPIIFVTKDTNLRIKADALGLDAQDYEPNQVPFEELYSGVTASQVSPEVVDEFYSQKKIQLKNINFTPNQYVLLKDETNPHHSATGRYNKEVDCIVPVYKPAEGLWGIFPKNIEQTFAIDMLLNDEIKLVSLVGKAGTGKTLLAIAAGLVKTVDEGVYHRLLVSRPVFPLGKDIGFLPGDIEEKLNPWMQPIYDNIDFLFGVSPVKSRRGAGKGCQELMNQGLLNIEPLTYIRGRSIPQQFMIVDEAQNLTPHEIKTIITRAGDATKIILTGDCFQIDNPYVDSNNNGLAYVVERFKHEAISGHITLVKGERSELSELASNLL